jgi:hypothetical protein
MFFINQVHSNQSKVTVYCILTPIFADIRIS